MGKQQLLAQGSRGLRSALSRVGSVGRPEQSCSSCGAASYSTGSSSSSSSSSSRRRGFALGESSYEWSSIQHNSHATKTPLVLRSARAFSSGPAPEGETPEFVRTESVATKAKAGEGGQNQNGHHGVSLDRREFIRQYATQLTEHYTIEKELGSGGFGSVFLVTHKLTGQQRAAKRIHMSKLKDNWDMLENEVKAMMDLDHPHVCKLYECFTEAEHVYLVLELLRGPDLFEHMMNIFGDARHDPPHRFSDYEAGVLMRHMLKAVFCCHSANIVHRDIKPENFMFAHDNMDNPDLRMIDLGLAKRTADPISGMMGTVAYMAPEMLQGQPYNRKCDLWPLGVIGYIMLTGEPLFSLVNDEDAVKEILHPGMLKRRLQQHRRVLSRDAMDFLKKMMQHDPTRRLNAKEALSHPFVMKTYMQDADRLTASGAGPRETISMDEIIRRMRLYAELPMLKRAALVVLAHMVGTSSVELERYRHAFRQLDTDGGGSVDMQEFRDGVKAQALAQQVDPESIIPDDFESFLWPSVDLNQSDDLNFTEFLAACLSADMHDLYAENHWRAVFFVLDANGSGALNADDLVVLFHGNSTSDEEIVKMWSEICVDRDTQIDIESFVSLMMSKDYHCKVSSPRAPA
ncbi:unnamed protein product [Amoebophrya sp. A25]|nr:unnamed protein product [Amoebophrya sp. A25]|eukprot:GSA25T00015250001.1